MFYRLVLADTASPFPTGLFRAGHRLTFDHPTIQSLKSSVRGNLGQCQFGFFEHSPVLEYLQKACSNQALLSQGGATRRTSDRVEELDRRRTGVAPDTQLAIGMVNSAPALMPVGHRVVIVFSFV